MEKSIGGHFDQWLPSAIQGDETYLQHARRKDAMLIVGGDEVGESPLASDPGLDEGSFVPLVPIKQRRPVEPGNPELRPQRRQKQRRQPKGKSFEGFGRLVHRVKASIFDFKFAI